MKTVTLVPHEFHANLLYNDDGLAPFFACDSEVKRADGSKQADFQDDGENWRARLSYQESNIVHPGDRTPRGTDWQLQQMREYRIKVMRHPAEDPIGEQGFTAHVAPRWEGMRGETDDGRIVRIPVPDGFGEGVNVQDAERYARVHKHKSGPVHARDGPIASMSHLLEHDRRGYRKVVQNDTDEKGRTARQSPRRSPDRSTRNLVLLMSRLNC